MSGSHTIRDQKTLLVVDDEPNMRSTLSEILINEGYQVHCAATGEEALELCQTIRPHVVLMDVRMPGIDGVETFRRLRHQQENVRVILMSAYSADELKEVALNEGVIAFLPKPLNLQKVVGLIDEATETTILVVSEEAESVHSLRNRLEEKGYRLSVARSPDDALDIVEQIRFDLIFLDTQLPCINSLELYLAIKKITPTAVAIMIAGAEGQCEALAREAVCHNAYTIVNKPLDIDHILELLKRFTEQNLSGDIRKPPLK